MVPVSESVLSCCLLLPISLSITSSIVDARIPSWIPSPKYLFPRLRSHDVMRSYSVLEWVPVPSTPEAISRKRSRSCTRCSQMPGIISHCSTNGMFGEWTVVVIAYISRPSFSKRTRSFHVIVGRSTLLSIQRGIASTPQGCATTKDSRHFGHRQCIRTWSG